LGGHDSRLGLFYSLETALCESDSGKPIRHPIRGLRLDTCRKGTEISAQAKKKAGGAAAGGGSWVSLIERSKIIKTRETALCKDSLQVGCRGTKSIKGNKKRSHRASWTPLPNRGHLYYGAAVRRGGNEQEKAIKGAESRPK